MVPRVVSAVARSVCEKETRTRSRAVNVAHLPSSLPIRPCLRANLLAAELDGDTLVGTIARELQTSHGVNKNGNEPRVPKVYESIALVNRALALQRDVEPVYKLAHIPANFIKTNFETDQ